MRAKFDRGKFRPLIEVRLTMGGASQDVWMLVDTGADDTTIDPDLAKALTGKDFDDLGEAGPDVGGVGTKPGAKGAPSRKVDAEITYLNRRFALKILVSPTPYPVLGRSEFMRRFDCRFYWSRNPPEFFVEPAQPPSAAKASTSKASMPVIPNPTVRPKKRKR